MSDFTDLCESFGLNPGDSDCIDIMMQKFHDDDDEDMAWYYEAHGFEFPDDDFEDDDK